MPDFAWFPRLGCWKRSSPPIQEAKVDIPVLGQSHWLLQKPLRSDENAASSHYSDAWRALILVQFVNIVRVAVADSGNIRLARCESLFWTRFRSTGSVMTVQSSSKDLWYWFQTGSITPMSRDQLKTGSCDGFGVVNYQMPKAGICRRPGASRMKSSAPTFLTRRCHPAASK